MTLIDRLPAPDDRIVILTGAGISKESGLDTFRDADGIWARVRLEDVATPEAFAADPDRVQAFYNDRRRMLREADIRPNAAHEALARLEAAWPGEVVVVTQNIDDLHERAGTRALIHMHGELLKARCMACDAINVHIDDLGARTPCPACTATGALRPHVVWFGEMPLEMERIGDLLGDCGLFVAIGTSGTVYPAAGFVQEARFHGRARTVEINLEPSEGHTLFHDCHHGPAGTLVPRLVGDLLAHANRSD
ncbi:NAD-dependent deacylase [Fodinicurvata sp. EGI_FJ10296]|uniref:NAD-dependent deacylase n=1 Tax=Fodinicurvata sp. EGI_FJ10296 TaxID=3231908 RepID=UPI00345221F8